MSYTGLERPLRAGQGGEYSTLNPNAVAPQFMKAYINCGLENDLWETERGCVKLNAAAIAGAPTIGTARHYVPQEGINRLIACGRDGTVHVSEDDGVTYLQLLNTLIPNKLIVPVTGGQELAGLPKKMFLFGGGQPVVLTGDPSNDAAMGDPAAGPVLVVQEVNGAVNLGDHAYAYSFRNAIGETKISPGVVVNVPNGNNQKVKITIPVGPVGTTSRIIYRTKAGGSGYLKLTEIFDNVTTEYLDNVADGDLAIQVAPVNNSTASVHTIARPPVDWTAGGFPTAGIIAEGRMIAWGNNNGVHRVYVSSAEDHEDFLSTPLVFSIFSGKGDGLVAGIYWRQQVWLFKKPRGIYRLDTSDIDVTRWQAHEHTDAVGIVGPLALTLIQGSDSNQFYDDVIFISPDASWHRLSKVQAYQEGDVNSSSISEKTYGQFLRQNIDKTRLPFCQMTYIESIEEVWAAVTAIGSQTNKMRIKMNIKRLPEFGPRFHHSTFPECESLSLEFNADGSIQPIAGGTGGFVRRMQENVYKDAGAVYTAEAVTWDDNFQDLGEAFKVAKKNYHFLQIEGVSCGDWNLACQVFIDGVLQPTVLTIPMKSKDPQFIVDQDHLDQQAMDSVSPLFRTARLRGRGRRISYRFFLSTETGFFKLTQINTMFDLGGLSGGNKK